MLEPLPVEPKNTINDNEDDDNEEWNDICRVCLGPDEEGHPLYKPCICAGTIAFVHQSCLEATIAEKRIDKCPVCHYKYQFKPFYANHTPERLSNTEVISGLVIRAANKWIPFIMRCLIVLTVWLGMLPLFTSYLYIAWCQGPSFITSRLGLQSDTFKYIGTTSNNDTHFHNLTLADTAESSLQEAATVTATSIDPIPIFKLLFMDIVSGLEITATIIISALSILSLVEHFRFHWQPQRLVQADNNNNGNNANINNINNNQQQERHPHQPQRRQQQQQNNIDNHEQDIDNEIIDQEVKRMLKNAGYEYNHISDKLNNDILTSEDDNNGDEHDLLLDVTKSTILPTRVTINSTEINTNTTKIPGIDIQRQSLGVMDQGQIISKDDINDTLNASAMSCVDTNKHTSGLHPLHPDYDNNNGIMHDDDENDHQHNYVASRNSSFYSISESLTSQLMKNDNDVDSFDNFSNNHDGTYPFHSHGTTIQRQRKRESIQQQLWEKRVIDGLVDFNSDSDKNYDENNDRDCENDNHDDNGNDIAMQMQKYRQNRQQHHEQENNRKLDPKNEELNDDANQDELEDVDAQFERMMKLQEEAEQQQEDDDDDNLFNFGRQNNQGNININDPNPLEQPAEPALGNQDMDLENAMPIDELIGLRGPLPSLFRNLVWFLAFNTTYLGVFMRIPKSIGALTFYQYSHSRIISKVASRFFEYLLLLPFVNLTREDDTKATLENVLMILNKETEKRNLILQAHDIAKIFLGYIIMTASVFLIQKVVQRFQESAATQQRSAINQQRQRDIPFDRRRVEEVDDVNGQKLSDLLECACAMAKVSILICLKMILLPFLLGIWLDIATLELSRSCVRDRVLLAGADIVGFFLIHWVFGITFMLMVTVSILQFREVLHPDILAGIIRPQESQPDMIANLLQDDGLTHVRRIIPSLVIYATLLALHVWLPALLLSRYNIDDYLPLFRPKVWYILSEQLQIPIELLAFHLAMLSILEKYKNRIGETQHAFLVRICVALQLADSLLPRSVEKFKLRATIPLKSDSDVYFSEKITTYTSNFDPFWENLVVLNENGGAVEDLIESKLQSVPPPMDIQYVMSNRLENGLQSDPFHFYIALPIFEATESNSPTAVTFAKKLLPPKVGRYRFRKRTKTKEKQEITIEVWEEVCGAPVKRPPVGWDYMGDNGGAVEQGRWAWEKEPKADVEKFLARRIELFPPNVANGKVLRSWKSKKRICSSAITLLKLIILVILSWATVSCCVYGALLLPLFIGRSLYSVFGIPDIFTHDPLVFIIGIVICYPLHLKILDLICADKPDYKRAHLMTKLKECMKVPYGKGVILGQAYLFWLVLSPLLIGFSYNFFFLETASFWSKELFSKLGIQYLLRVWVIGSVFINISMALTYFKALRRGFFARLGRVAFNNLNDDNNEVPINNADNEPEEGITEKFVNTLIVIVRDHEWDKVDRKLLVDDTSLPLAMKSFVLLAGPATASFGCYKMLQYYTFISNPHLVSEVNLFRYFTIVVLISTLISAFGREIKDWLYRFYEAAHNAARQRYLLGQVLLDRQNSES